MPRYRNRLPQLQPGRLFLADGGLETTLVFHDKRELPCFAAFDALKDDSGWALLRRYYDTYARLARANGVGIVLDSATWRASADWGAKLGYAAAALADANRRAISLLLEVRAAHETPATPIVVSGALGPRGDGYRADARMSARQARDYHAAQIETLAQTDADMVAAFTLNYVEEAVGIIDAARDAAMPVAVAFTLETDGRLPSGETLAEAVTRADAATGGYAAYYMINCAHPTHFRHVLAAGGPWRERIRGLRANASRRSHQELDESAELDAGDPAELGGEYRELAAWLPKLAVAGGCCGTDHRHVAAICGALKKAA